MYSVSISVRWSEDRVVECPVSRLYATIEEARKDADSNLLAIAYRIFDKNGYRVFSKKA